MIVLSRVEFFGLLHEQHPERLFPHTVIVKTLFTVVDIIVQATEPDRAELIQVGGCDGQEFQTVEYTPVFMFRLVQYPVIEFNPAQITADVMTLVDLERYSIGRNLGLVHGISLKNNIY
jgi:hypothetical protein